MSHKFTFVPMGGTARAKIHSGEDIRHLNELDEKLWAVQSCPVNGLEIPADSLELYDTNHDGNIHVSEVLESAQWLCSVLANPDVLLRGKELRATDIADADIAAVAKELAKDQPITVAIVQDAIAGVTIEAQPLPEAPYPADVLAAFRACQNDYATYFQLAKLNKLGLATIPEDTPVPGMKEKDFQAMANTVAQWDAATADIQAANDAALTSAQAKYQPLRKLVLMQRDFHTLLRNFVSLEDFYSTKHKAIFQAGTLVIDQRACYLTMRVSDMAKQDAQAAAAGMFLVYCDCTNRTINEKMQIVAAITVGEIRNIQVGKNALFYDRQGRDWDAVVTKIIDNPISIGQAFFSPYRKFGQWISGLVNKSVAEKESKSFTTLTDKVQADLEKPMEQKTAETKAAPQAFDIAKFAGIFAAIGMALGYIGEAISSLIRGVNDTPIWQTALWILGLFLIISGPSMLIAWFKLRKRNLAPLLNANGWAINADAIISVLFGATLTDLSHFPMLNLQDPLEIKKQSKSHVLLWVVIILVLLLAAAALCWWQGWISIPRCWC